MSSTLRASRMSSVFGLKASPSTAMTRPSRGSRTFRMSATSRWTPLAVHVHHRPERAELAAERGRRLDQGVGVLREARAAVPEAGVQERGADPRVEAHPLHHLVDVAAGELAQVGDLVDEGDLRGQERVGRVLDDLGRVDVRDDHRPLERRVELEQRHRHLLAGRADDDPVGAELSSIAEPSRRNSGFETTSKLTGRRPVALDDRPHQVARAHRHRGLVDDDLVAVERLGDAVGDLLDGGEVGLAGGLRAGCRRR